MSPPPTVGKRARKVADTRARIIRVAQELFVSNGFSGTTIDDIIGRANVGRSSFFRYFASKEAVLFAPAIETQHWVLENLDARPPGESLLCSVLAVCLGESWPDIDPQRLACLSTIIAAEPRLAAGFRNQMTSSSHDRLHACFARRSPSSDHLTIKLIADLTITWMDWAIQAHIRDGQPLSAHFTDVINRTASLAEELLSLPSTP